jgi:uncharacterized protein (DUF885 family)
MLSRRHLITTSAAAGLGACAGVPGGASGTPGTAAPSVIESAAPDGRAALLAEFFERVFDGNLSRYPELATSLGDKRGYDRWDDDSPAAEAADLARQVTTNQTLQRLAAPLALNPQDRLSVQLFGKQTDRAVAAARFTGHTYLFNQMFGTHTSIPTFLANQHAVATLEDAQAYITRLEGVGRKLDTHRLRSEASAAAGLTPPKHIYDYVLSDCRNLLAGAPFGDGATDAPMWASAQAKINGLTVDDATKSRLKAQARSVLLSSVKPAYERLITSLESQQASARTTDGVWALRDGEAYYAERLANQTTTSLTANEVHQIGLDAVARIHGEMGAIMRRVGFTGTRDAFFDDLESNPRFFVDDTPEGKARYMREATALIDTMRTRLPEVFNVQPRAPMEVRAVEAFRERSAGLAFYQRPTPDGSRPGIYYINTYNVKAIPTYQMEALAYHEGIPGHHMQIAIAQELEGIPRFRKFGGFTAYSEGWGLYSELLPKEMGFYSDPYSDFGRLTLELRRAIRLVVDTGLHAKRWPRQQAVDYILANQPGDLPSAERDIDRYIVMPGQATAYLIGQMEILRLREAARTRLRGRFDIRQFHDVVLTNGAVPLDVLAGLVGEMG